MSKYRNLILQIVAGLAVIGAIGFIAIQFVPVDKTNPPVVNEPRWDSPQTQALAERACYDCHSNQTKWPWYSNVAPVSWVLAHNVKEGRAELNFSEWGLNNGSGGEVRGENEEAEEHEDGEGREGVEVDEIVETVQEGEMPPQDYVIMHPEANLTNAEIQALIAGLEATFGSQSEGAMVK
jgi:cytochrome c551/c552